MSRQLSNYEIFDALERNEQLYRAVQEHEEMFGFYGWATWDQIQGDVDQYGVKLPIPPRGLAFNDSFYGDVVVFSDARGILHFTAVDDPGLIAEISKPVFESDPDYWQVFEEVAAKYAAAGGRALDFGQSSLGILLGVALIALIVVAKR